MPGALSVFVITFNPSDFPGLYVMREQKILGGKIYAAGFARTAKTLDEIRARVPKGLTRLDRAPGDDPVIVEVWV
jgi:hypothetical protein